MSQQRENGDRGVSQSTKPCCEILPFCSLSLSLSLSLYLSIYLSLFFLLSLSLSLCLTLSALTAAGFYDNNNTCIRQKSQEIVPRKAECPTAAFHWHTHTHTHRVQLEGSTKWHYMNHHHQILRVGSTIANQDQECAEELVPVPAPLTRVVSSQNIFSKVPVKKESNTIKKIIKNE